MVVTILVSKSINMTLTDLSISFKQCSHFYGLIHGKLGGELVNGETDYFLQKINEDPNFFVATSKYPFMPI